VPEQSWSYPSDEVLLELGKFTYAAAEIEAVVYWVCRLIKSRGDAEGQKSTGERIKWALADTAEMSDRELARRCVAWLNRAQRALDGRHSVIHAEHMVRHNVDPLTNEVIEAGDFLVFRPAERTARRIGVTQVVHEFTVEGLRQVRAELDSTWHEYRELVGRLGDYQAAARVARPMTSDEEVSPSE